MKIAICYVAVAGQRCAIDLLARFVETAHQYPAGYPFDFFVLCNGGKLSTAQQCCAAFLKPQFIERPNDPGWDLTAYMDAAEKLADYDLMGCFGESIYFHRAGWLKRMAETYSGPGVYGTMASHLANLHLNTTGFFVSPKVLASFPSRPTNKQERYEFEHGRKPFWRWVEARGNSARLVTFGGVYASGDWRKPANGYWRGNQSDCLFWCRHTDSWFAASDWKRKNWTRRADFGR